MSELKSVPAIRGVIDRFEFPTIVGWAARLIPSDDPVTLQLHLGDVHIRDFEATIAREDVAKLIPGAETSGFNLQIGSSDAEAFFSRSRRKSWKDVPLRIVYQDPKGGPPIEIAVPPRIDPKVPVADLKGRIRKKPEKDAVAKTKRRAADHRQAAQTLASHVADAVAAQGEPAVRAIAFYLPQFHPFPENDAWWGKGFTEWSNVSSARPSFPDHNQPAIPADLGYYDLRLDEVREAQAAMAREYGIEGFCYYYYWFSGRPLMDLPINRLLSSGKPDFPFCLCWANESWSRRWDGQEVEKLIGQEHQLELDKAFIDDILPFLKDPRYIRVGGRPLIVVYRPDILDQPRALLEHWREVARREGVGELMICGAETFQAGEPGGYGFDAAVEFPPHRTQAGRVEKDIADLSPAFTGRAYSYRGLIDWDLTREPPSYKRFRTVFPGWDNTPRRGLDGHFFYGSTPELFESWLAGVVEEVRGRFAGDERLVFINAWNEWAEGAHLEPDRRWGRAYLEAVRRVLFRGSGIEVLLDKLQRRLGSDDGAHETLALLRTRLTTLERANAFLATRLRDAREANPIAPVLEGRLLLAGSKVKQTPLPFGIDCTDLAGDDRHPVRANIETMAFYGWAWRRGEPAWQEYLALWSEAEKKVVYAIPIRQRVARPDVAQTFPGAEKSGFKVSFSLRGVAPGEYRIALLDKVDEAQFEVFVGPVVLSVTGG